MTDLGRRQLRADGQSSAHSLLARSLGVLRDLFPEPARGPVRSRGLRVLAATAEFAAFGLAALLLLVRIPGTPVWRGIYAEDLGIFLVDALQHPWAHLLTPYAGYMQLLSQLIAQLAVMVPLPDAAAVFAISGALTASACALFVFHASAGHIRSPALRALLGMAVVLLPVAPLEIADSGVDAPWYVMFALFWAALWRPRLRSGVALAALIGFLAVTSNTLAMVFAPLFVCRVIALPRLREHGVTAGWVAGCLVQLPYIISGASRPGSRVGRLATPGQSTAFYGHDVLLPSLGWHLSWFLRDSVGRNGATLVVGGLLAVFFAWALITQPRPARVFVVTALATGFLMAFAAATLSWWVPILPVTPVDEPGCRYTAIPILLITAAAIVAVDCYLRGALVRPRAVVAAVALVAVLAGGWITDFRFPSDRSHPTVWAPVAARWLSACQRDPAGTIREQLGPGNWARIPCQNVRG